jgi:hypothetical protein
MSIQKPDNVSQEMYEQCKQISTNVYNCVCRTQKMIYRIHGANSEHKNKSQFPLVDVLEKPQCLTFARTSNVDNTFTTNDYYLPIGEHVDIHFDDSCNSLILSGLVDNTVTIHNKINHILMRYCSGTNICIKDGTISGVDMLYCKNMVVEETQHNYLNIEYCSDIDIKSTYNHLLLHALSSIDVSLNKIQLAVNPFINVVFTDVGTFYIKHNMRPNVMIYL